MAISAKISDQVRLRALDLAKGEEPNLLERGQQNRDLACGASRSVVLPRSAERGEPKVVKAKPYGGAMRGHEA